MCIFNAMEIENPGSKRDRKFGGGKKNKSNHICISMYILLYTKSLPSDDDQ